MRTVQVGGSVSGRVQSRGVSPRTIYLGGAASDGNIPFPLMKKGRDLSDAKVNDWRNNIEAWFQGERWSHGEHE
jgi:hypothetical protein